MPFPLKRSLMILASSISISYLNVFILTYMYCGERPFEKDLLVSVDEDATLLAKNRISLIGCTWGTSGDRYGLRWSGRHYCRPPAFGYPADGKRMRSHRSRHPCGARSIVQKGTSWRYGLVVDIAGRQRLAIQQMAKECVLIASIPYMSSNLPTCPERCFRR